MFWAPRRRRARRVSSRSRGCASIRTRCARPTPITAAEEGAAVRLFPASMAARRQVPGSWVFTALSHDIIAHETTHAILDGLHRRFAEATNADRLAFHEAFADIVALLQHFTLPKRCAIRSPPTRGDLNQRDLLSGLARQFGQATGRTAPCAMPSTTRTAGERARSHPARRRARAARARSDSRRRGVRRLRQHLRTRVGRSVAARRAAARSDRRRASTPTWSHRLAAEATKSADHVLRMCIRALDYLPPVDVRFGEFLRAHHHRRHRSRSGRPDALSPGLDRGVPPSRHSSRGCLSLAPDSLLWEGDSSVPSLSISGSGAKLNLIYVPGAKRRRPSPSRIARIVQQWLTTEKAAGQGRRSMAGGVRRDLPRRAWRVAIVRARPSRRP